MNKEVFAAKLNNRQYPFELTTAEEAEAAAAGLVVVYGASDDLMEFEGAIHDEVYPPRSDGGDVYVTEQGPLEDHADCECKWCGFGRVKSAAKKITALWCKEEGYSWTYQSLLPHATFEIMEDGEHYCRGLVFDIAALK